MSPCVFVIACTSRKVDIHVGSNVDKHENKKLTMKAWLGRHH
jgi:hypothetical protein